MKKFLLAIMLLVVSVSYGCDAPYQEIQGFKLGCPLDVKNMRKIGNNIYNQELKNSEFDLVDIELDGGRIKAISFYKDYNSMDMAYSEGEKLKNTLAETWGGFTEKETKKSKQYLSKEITSNVLNSINIFISESFANQGSLMLTYKAN